MTEALLPAFLALFPSRLELKSNEFKGWRDYMNSFQSRIVALSDGERRQLFLEASDALTTMPMHESWSMPYWFFSHPTFEVFDAFVHDGDICRAFADFLEFAVMSTSRGNRRSRRQLKKMAQTGSKEGGSLAVRYVNLLKSDDYYTFGYFLRKRRRSRYFILPRCTISEKSLDQFFAYAENQANGAVLRDITKCLKELPCVMYEMVRVFQSSLVPPKSVDIVGLGDNLVRRIDIENIQPLLPRNWHDLNGIRKNLEHYVRIGRWPKFGTQETTPLHVDTRAAIVRHEVNAELIEQITHIADPGYALFSKLSRIHHGLMPIGLKIHAVHRKVPGLEFLAQGAFSAHNAGMCFNLPPVGNMRSVAHLFDVIRKRSGVSFLDNMDYQIQVCTQGELRNANAAILGVCFYLGSDRVRRYRRENFTTTASYSTGDRLIIYGAQGVEKSFKWWSGARGAPIVGPMPSTVSNRTDVLTAMSLRDIDTVNLVASLLIHLQFGGYWCDLGQQLVDDVRQLLSEHQLLGVLDVEWTRKWSVNNNDEEFLNALGELTSYVFEEVERINRAVHMGDQSAARTGILYEMKEILAKYRAIVYQEGDDECSL